MPPRIRLAGCGYMLSHKLQPDGIVIRPRAFAPAHPLEPNPYATSDAGETEIQLWFPNQWLIRTPMGDDTWMCTFLTFTPVDDEHTDIFGLALRSFQPDNVFLDEFHIQHTLFVMEQDQRIVESIRPYVPPMNLQQELHVPSDTPTARHRAMIARTLHSQLYEVVWKGGKTSLELAAPFPDTHDTSRRCVHSIQQNVTYVDTDVPMEVERDGEVKRVESK